jgi:hypothetical protein
MRIGSLFETRLHLEDKYSEVFWCDEIECLDFEDVDKELRPVLYVLEYKLSSNNSPSRYLLRDDFLFFIPDVPEGEEEFYVWFATVPEFNAAIPRFDVFVKSRKSGFCRKSATPVPLDTWFMVPVDCFGEGRILARLRRLS